ncbi:iron-sulfur cluster assembly accessory protein [Rickettsiales bacterium]|jgi:iron-sulfur cluster insertion protein|nr:iron-sulfur cluster assembly accessory protein [Rickettsiales bacterium]|tara:strand:- start:3540 stop:3872 length:333 start_codon:yes stop_codon:yes gene_type:complete
MSDISFSKSAIDHIKSVKLKDKNNNKFLRIAVSGGGCSGFQYVFSLDEKTNNDDINLVDGQETLAVTDKTSLPFLKGSNVDYVKELGACYFKVSNPNASNNCGCGSSFSI